MAIPAVAAALRIVVPSSTVIFCPSMVTLTIHAPLSILISRSQAALREINLLFAAFTYLFPVKLIGKYFHFLAAGRAGAEKRFQALEGFKTGTMLRGSHKFLLVLSEKFTA
jgi:hypothetical protein